MYWHSFEETVICLVVVCKTKNDLFKSQMRAYLDKRVFRYDFFSCPDILSGCSHFFADKFTQPLSDVRRHCAVWFFRDLDASCGGLGVNPRWTLSIVESVNWVCEEVLEEYE